MATLKDKILGRLTGSVTEQAFEAGGKAKWQEYQAVNRDTDGVNEDQFFTGLLGEELAQKYIQANGIQYGSKINLHNAYTIWGNDKFR